MATSQEVLVEDLPPDLQNSASGTASAGDDWDAALRTWATQKEERDRGKATALASMGYAVSEAVMPKLLRRVYGPGSSEEVA